MSEIGLARVFTHRRPEETRPALESLIEVARRLGVVLAFDPAETRKLALEAADGLELDSPEEADVQLCFALGGDGTILTALRRYAGTSVPVFGVNFGEIGFLAAVEREDAAAGFERVFAGDYEVLGLPGLALSGVEASGADGAVAINDVSVHRQPGHRVASLAYSVGSDEVGRVRCDGLVVATPAGSTGYNLANGGPVMAWGVEGFAVSFIAPHSLTARALVVAPDDVLSVRNRSDDEAVEVAIDGRPVTKLEPGAVLQVRFDGRMAMLAQLPGATFYQRLREKFGRLATVP
jgi:NAD+ kinase